MSEPGIPKELVARFRAGDRAVLAEVYGIFAPRVDGLLKNGFTVHSTGARVPGLAKRADRADVTQQTFERAFAPDALLAYDGERDYWPYLATVARHELVTYHRRRGREVLAGGRDSWTEDEVAAAEPEGEPEHGWLEPRSREIARQYAESLGEPLRSVHHALYVESLSQRDAAEQLGFSRFKLRKLEDRLRNELFALLKKAGIRG